MENTLLGIERTGNFSVCFNFTNDIIVAFGLKAHAAEDLLSFAKDALAGNEAELVGDDGREFLKAKDGTVTILVYEEGTGAEQFRYSTSAKKFAFLLADSVSRSVQLWTIPNFYGILKRQGQARLDELEKTPDIAEMTAKVKKLLDEIIGEINAR